MTDNPVQPLPVQPAPVQPVQQKIRPFAGARKEWKFVLGFIVLSLFYWGAHLAYQFKVEPNADFAIIRANAFAGATLISAALLCSSLFKWKPTLARFVNVRRSLGVMGFVFIFLHALNVLRISQYNITVFFAILDPFLNPVLFGLVAFPVFFLMALTSCDWFVQKLGFKRWKGIHRLVYIAYPLVVFHYLLINPFVLSTPPGYVLLAVTAAALAGQFYWFVRTARKKGLVLGTVLGILIILFWALLAYLAYA